MSLSIHAFASMLITVAALALLSRPRVPLEYASLGILVLLVLFFELFPLPGQMRGTDVIAVFGNEALVTICLLLVLAKGVEASGALRPVARVLTALWLRHRGLAMLATLVVAAFISAFANNTPIVVMLLPILVGVAHRIGVAPSRMLMPVGFATIVGGMSTTIGTSTNLLVVSVISDLGVAELGIFDFAVPAVTAGLVALLYLWLVMPRLLPERPTMLEDAESRQFSSVFTVGADSALAGVSLSQAMNRLGESIRITKIERGEHLELVRLPTLVLQPGDRVSIRATPESIRFAHDLADSTLAGDITSQDSERLVEIVVTPDSPLHGKRLGQLHPQVLRGLSPIGWHRPGKNGASSPSRFPDPLLRTGDVLLMQGPNSDVTELMNDRKLLVLARSLHVPRLSKAPVAVGIMAGVVLASAFGLLPIAASALIGTGLMLLSRSLSWQEAVGAIDTRLALVIAASLGLGMSLVSTGAADWIATQFAGMVSTLPPPLVLSLLLLLTALLTEVVTNNAVAVIATPIAVTIAAELGQPALPFALAVLFGANMSYLTPIGYQTNLLVMSAGGYRFSDFLRGGLPLQAILWLVLSVLLTLLYL